eukprot:989066_1
MALDHAAHVTLDYDVHCARIKPSILVVFIDIILLFYAWKPYQSSHIAWQRATKKWIDQTYAATPGISNLRHFTIECQEQRGFIADRNTHHPTVIQTIDPRPKFALKAWFYQWMTTECDDRRLEPYIRRRCNMNGNHM